MASRKGKTKLRIRISKELLKGIIVRVALLLAATILLFQLTVVLSDMLFINRLDEVQAVAFKYSFSSLPFDCRDVRLDFSGQEVLWLNVTFETQNYSLYSESYSSDEIKRVGALEHDGEPSLVLWSSDISEEKEYVISGRFVDFYRFGTRERMPVLLVQDYHEFGLLDAIMSESKLVFFQITMGLVALTSAFILAFFGTIAWFIAKIDEMESKEQVKEA